MGVGPPDLLGEVHDPGVDGQDGAGWERPATDGETTLGGYTRQTHGDGPEHS